MMNPQYMPQQQQQQPQQPAYYSGVQNAPPYGELNSNIPLNNPLKGPNNQSGFPPQKQMHGPPPTSNAPPMQMQPPYYMNNMQANTQNVPPPSSSPHMISPSQPQNTLANQMSNMSIGNPQRPPPSQNYPPLQGGANPPLNAPSNLNGFSDSADRVPPGPDNSGQMEPQSGKSGQPPGQDSHPPMPTQAGLSKPPQSGSLPYPGHNANNTPQSFGPHVTQPTPQGRAPQPGMFPPTGQQNQAHPPPPGSNNLSAPVGPPNLSGPPLPGQQNIISPSMQGQKLSAPGYPNSPNVPTTPLGAQANLAGQQYQGSPNIPQQSYPGQQNMPLPGQQNLAAPPLPGQPNLSSPQMQQPGLSAPPGMGHSQLASPVAPNPGGFPNNQSPAQRQYMPGPPLPGQPAPGSMGMSRQPPALGPGYQQGQYQQQGYQSGQPDMYGGQRSPYQGGGLGASPGYQPPMQSQQTRRLDPDQMPSPIQVIQDDQRARGGVFITNQKGLVPPLVTTKFTVQDQGNASPRFIRSTMYTVPTTADIIKQTSVPFGLILSPMARVAEGEYDPPIVDMGDIGPVRCVRCKAYMSPFMQFIDAGRRFQCMFCKATTEVPTEYFQHLDHTGQRMDRFERPELMLGTYEYLATKDYCRNNNFPKPPAIVFVIDVSYNTVKSGLINLLCAEMKKIIRNLPVDIGQTKSNMRVGFITYNNTVHFYNINPCLAQPQMMVVGDVQDVFMPLLDGFLCDPEESESVIDSLMVQIPAMFADTRETETILAPAITAGLEALKASDCAGKLMVFHSSLPIAEAPGKLKNRDDRKLLGTEKEKAVLAPQNNVYNNLGQECVGSGCSVDLFMFNNSYVDIATIGQVARLTGGEVYKYTYFQADIDGDRLITDVINNIMRPIAFDAVMRVRTSTGVRATDFYGHFFMSNTTDMELASIDSNKAVAIEVKHDDKLVEEEGVYIQAALLYTSCSGIRRLRIINLSLRTSSQMAELYRACDLDAIINFFSKQSIFKLIESTSKSIKDNLISRCAKMLAAYRQHCASPSSVGQLILPECMKLLPLYVNCILKSDAISGGADMTIDDRSFVMQAVVTMPISISVVYFYPKLIPLHDIDPQGTDMPQMLRCSIDKFTDDGAYLLENSIHMFLWLGLGLSPQWVQGVFGVPSVVQVDTERTVLPNVDSPLNKRINDIIAHVRAERHRCMRLTIVRQRDKLEMVLRHFLVEDRGNDGSSSYVDFLCHMHKEIRTLLSQ